MERGWFVPTHLDHILSVHPSHVDQHAGTQNFKHPQGAELGNSCGRLWFRPFSKHKEVPSLHERVLVLYNTEW